jgi:hypothetical protein
MYSSLPLLKLISEHPNCEFLIKLRDNYTIFNDIYEKCEYRHYQGCGSYLFDGNIYEYCPDMYEKQKLLYDTAKKATSVLEVGVYMGHSIFIMLLANPSLKITCIDIDDQLSVPALSILEEQLNLFESKKITTLDSLKKIQDRSVLIVYEIETRQKGQNEVDQKFILWAEIYIYNPSTDLFERKYRKLLDFV